MEVKDARSLGWTRQSTAVTLLRVMEEHRRRAGERVVQLREAANLNQEELAHAAELSVKTISRFENGRHDGRRQTVRAIAKALGVTERDILGEPPDPLGLNGDPHLARIERKLDALLVAAKLDPADFDDDAVADIEGAAAGSTALLAGEAEKTTPAKRAPARKRRAS